MNGLLRRLTRRRAATADEHPPEAPAASEPVDDATVVSTEETAPLSEEARAREEELERRRRDLPAGLDPEALESGVGESARRSALRRRVRYLRAAREVLLRDLGGFYYEVHRAAGTSPSAGHRQILEAKAQRLAAIDGELRELLARLDQPAGTTTVVREPGVGGSCPTCGELHGSDAAWCWHCGTPLSDKARARHAEEIDEAIAVRQAAAAEEERRRAAAAEAGEATTADHQTLAEYTSRRREDEQAPPGRPHGPEADAGNGSTGEHTQKLQPDSDPVGERRR